MLIKENMKKKTVKKSRRLEFYFCILFSFLFSISSSAQCAMCRAALGGGDNQSQAQAVNDGIVYLMIIPYLLVGGIGYAVYRMRKNKKQE